jgi:hypothetical protein
MKICPEHWKMCRDAIESRGMSGLVAGSGEEAFDRMADELHGGTPPFDPLMSLNWHFTNAALASGGLYLMSQNPDDPEGHYCPLCEFTKHAEGFDAPSAVAHVADQMLEHCRTEGLVPKLA